MRIITYAMLLFSTQAICQNHAAEPQKAPFEEPAPPIEEEVRRRIEALKDKDWRVRVGAAQFLGDMMAHSAIPQLIKALKEDKNAEVRQAVVNAFAKMGEKAHSTIPQLIETLKKDDDAWVRREAAFALGRMGVQANVAIPQLMEASKDEHPWVRQVASEALQGLKALGSVFTLDNTLGAQTFFKAHKDNPEKAIEIYQQLTTFADSLNDEQIDFVVAGLKDRAGRYPDRRVYERWGASSFDLAQAWLNKQKSHDKRGELFWPQEMTDGLVLAANKVPDGWQKLKSKIGPENFESLVGNIKSEKMNAEGRKILFGTAQSLIEPKSQDVPNRVQRIALSLSQQVSEMTPEELLLVKDWAVAIYKDEAKSHKSYESLVGLMGALVNKNQNFKTELDPLRNEALELLKPTPKRKK